MCVVELCQRLNYRICLIIYWTLRVMKKYWSCIKGCVEVFIYIYPGCIKSYIDAYWKMWEEEDSYSADFS